jgi:hypothetical protein
MIGQSPSSFSLPSNLQAGALGIGSPLAGDVMTAWTGDALVQSAFGSPAAVQGLALFQSSDNLNGSGEGIDMDFSVVGSHLNGGDLLVGLLNPTLSGVLSSSNSVTFEIDRNGIAAFSETFTSNSAFTAFFHNNVLDLGTENATLSGGYLNLDFKFEFNSTNGGGGIKTDLLFGNTVLTPEPSSVALLALGALALLAPVALARFRGRRII